MILLAENNPGNNHTLSSDYLFSVKNISHKVLLLIWQSITMYQGTTTKIFKYKSVALEGPSIESGFINKNLEENEWNLEFSEVEIHMFRNNQPYWWFQYFIAFNLFVCVIQIGWSVSCT